MITVGQLRDAEREALNQLDRWNDVTGAVEKDSGWYHELQSVIEDAVHIGIQMSTYGKVKIDRSGNVKREI